MDASTSSPSLAASVLGGLITGLITVVVTVSLGVLIFAGAVPDFVGNGLALALLTTAVTGLIFAARSCFRGAVSGVQDHPSVALALIATAVGAGAAGAATADAVFATIVVSIGAATAVTGVVLLVLGWLRFGEFVRYIPFPVVGGFLAGTGWLLLLGAIEVMVGEAPTWRTVEVLWQDDALLRWLPAVGLSAAAVWWQRRTGTQFALPAALVVVITGFYGMLVLGGTAPASARADGWLLGPFPAVTWPPVTWEQFAGVDGSLVLDHWAGIATVVVLATLSLALSSTGIEVAIGENLDFDRELRTAGLSNLLVGLGGGPVGYPYAAVTILGHRMGMASRASAVVAAGVAVLALVAGLQTLTFVPVAAFGTILVALGFSFLAEWLLDTWRSLPRSDYAVLVAIVVVIAVWGLLWGVGVGLLLALLLFVVRASRIAVVKHRFTAENYASTVDRHPAERRALQAAGPQLLILELQGFIFFGTAASVTREVTRHRAGVTGGFVVVDLRRTVGLDPSAVVGLIRIARTLAASQGQLVLSGLGGGAQHQLDRVSADLHGEGIVVLSDLDHSVAWCEDHLLRQLPGPMMEEQEVSAAELLEVDPEQLAPYIERRRLDRGTRLIEQGVSAPGLIIVTQGHVAVVLERADGQTNRLRVLRPGTIVGEMSFLLGIPTTATVLADTDVTIEVLTTRQLAHMERQNPQLSLALHRRLAATVSERLATANRTIMTALD